MSAFGATAWRLSFGYGALIGIALAVREVQRYAKARTGSREAELRKDPGGTESEDKLTVNPSSKVIGLHNAKQSPSYPPLPHLVSSSAIFNDSVHGHIELHPLLVKIIDTPQFQRLRHIKQMGGIYFVYPGACHNRFEHSLGVAHLAGELVSTIRQKQPELGITDEDVLCVRIAGLCHDLGHGPFSHLFDGMFIPHVMPGKEWKHETASVDMLQHLIDVNALKKEFEEFKECKLYGRDIAFIKELIKGEMVEGVPKRKGHRGDMSFLYQIVANKTSGVDVDKWDYFARDCQHLGMSSNFDHKRFMSFVRVIEVIEDGSRRHICLRDKEVNNLYDMFYIRKMLHQRACYHKTVKAIEFMYATFDTIILLRDILALANDHVKIPGRDGVPRSIAECVDDMVAYSKLNDSIIQLIKVHPNPDSNPNLKKAQDLIARLERRQLYTCIGETTPRVKSWFKSDDEMERAQEILDASEDCGNLTADDIIVHEVTFDYGHKGKNPIESMHFYDRAKYEPRKIPEEEVRHMLPGGFSWKLVRVYCKKSDSSDKAQKCFDEWWKKEKDSSALDQMPDSIKTGVVRNVQKDFEKHQN